MKNFRGLTVNQFHSIETGVKYVTYWPVYFFHCFPKTIFTSPTSTELKIICYVNFSTIFYALCLSWWRRKEGLFGAHCSMLLELPQVFLMFVSLAFCMQTNVLLFPFICRSLPMRIERLGCLYGVSTWFLYQGRRKVGVPSFQTDTDEMELSLDI